eukprot:CAMPEP_0115827590 /NCGR_PEP_ID=MMETSP0287-20121206/124_1 /TAXON_ID=412157 /ORGANISM="Chrysochromulina rotalis, Strain UIO044" /LENGTH=148 /DNA_ID=CAMNT_0003280755 /DNA_START=468 /DNA_END=914 /DNA_ORIENTATION=+
MLATSVRKSSKYLGGIALAMTVAHCQADRTISLKLHRMFSTPRAIENQSELLHEMSERERRRPTTPMEDRSTRLARCLVVEKPAPRAATIEVLGAFGTNDCALSAHASGSTPKVELELKSSPVVERFSVNGVYAASTAAAAAAATSLA